MKRRTLLRAAFGIAMAAALPAIEVEKDFKADTWKWVDLPDTNLQVFVSGPIKEAAVTWTDNRVHALGMSTTVGCTTMKKGYGLSVRRKP